MDSAEKLRKQATEKLRQEAQEAWGIPVTPELARAVDLIYTRLLGPVDEDEDDDRRDLLDVFSPLAKPWYDSLQSARPTDCRVVGKRGPYKKCFRRRLELVKCVSLHRVRQNTDGHLMWREELPWKTIAASWNSQHPRDRLSAATLKNAYFRGRRQCCPALFFPALAGILALDQADRDRLETPFRAFRQSDFYRGLAKQDQMQVSAELMHALWYMSREEGSQ